MFILMFYILMPSEKSYKIVLMVVMYLYGIGSYTRLYNNVLIQMEITS